MSNIEAKIYSCPICGTIPLPNLYERELPYNKQNNSCYLVKDGKLALPFVKMKPIPCCGGWYAAPYHPNSREYLESIRPYLLFFAPIVPWVNSFIKKELEETNEDKCYSKDTGD